MRHKIRLFCILAIIIFGTANTASALFIYNNHAYELTSGEFLTWFEAEAEAVAWGGHLVTINNQAEQDWLAATFTARDLLIGFNDIQLEGTWTWSSGESVTYTHWASFEPNNYTGDQGQYTDGEDIAVMNWVHANPNPGDMPDMWNDLPTDFTSRGIMEKPVPEPATMLLLGTGLMGLAAVRRKMRK